MIMTERFLAWLVKRRYTFNKREKILLWNPCCRWSCLEKTKHEVKAFEPALLLESVVTPRDGSVSKRKKGEKERNHKKTETNITFFFCKTFGKIPRTETKRRVLLMLGMCLQGSTALFNDNI